MNSHYCRILSQLFSTLPYKVDVIGFNHWVHTNILHALDRPDNNSWRRLKSWNNLQDLYLPRLQELRYKIDKTSNSTFTFTKENSKAPLVEQVCLKNKWLKNIFNNSWLQTYFGRMVWLYQSFRALIKQPMLWQI